MGDAHASTPQALCDVPFKCPEGASSLQNVCGPEKIPLESNRKLLSKSITELTGQLGL